VERLITTLRARPGVVVHELESAWSVRVPKGDGLVIELTIPRDVLEWFVTAYDKAGAKTWSDWVDYCGYERGESVERLAVEMSDDIDRFIATLLQATAFRVVSSPSLLGAYSTAEWQVDGQWQDVWGIEASSK